VKRLAKFLRLTTGDKLLLAAAVPLRLLIAVGLRLLPFWVWQRLLRRAARAEDAAGSVDAVRLERVVRAVHRSERVAPVGVCLARALTGYWLLTWMGQPCRVRIGVAIDSARMLRSHAWLESRGEVLLGGEVEGLSPVSMEPASFRRK
jgi:Transglutaminase-like superfamily